MYKKCAIAFLSLAFAAALPSAAFAETVMQKVARTGVLTAGTSRDAVPFAYAQKDGKLVGYSVDMLNQIKDRLEKETGRKIQLRLVGLAPKERIPQVVSRQVDIVCDASSFTWERDKSVDFSVSYAVTGTQLLIKKGSNLDSPESWAGKRIGVLRQTTNEKAVRKAQPKAKLVYIKDRAEGFTALQQGKIDALASDSIFLEAWLHSTKNAESFQMVPDRPLSREGIACMVPENNSKFLNSVNYTLIRFMQKVLAEDEKFLAVFDRWFGFNGVVPLNRDLRDLAFETMRLVVESKEEIPANEL